jgi:DnaK suppressor protein
MGDARDLTFATLGLRVEDGGHAWPQPERAWSHYQYSREFAALHVTRITRSNDNESRESRAPCHVRETPTAVNYVGMDAATRRQLRDRLLAIREELIQAGRLDIPPARTDAVAQPDDDEAPLTEMTQAIASNRNRERAERLEQIREALALIDEDPDDYGMCEVCEEPIPARRLELMPWVTLCVRCQERREADRPGSRKHLTDYR